MQAKARILSIFSFYFHSHLIRGVARSNSKIQVVGDDRTDPRSQFEVGVVGKGYLLAIIGLYAVLIVEVDLDRF